MVPHVDPDLVVGGGRQRLDVGQADAGVDTDWDCEAATVPVSGTMTLHVMV